MARNGTGKILGGLTLGVITVAAGAALGYYVIGGAHPGQTAGATAGIQEAGTPPDAGPAPAPAAPRVKPARPNSDYTAPGAPRIHIVEARSPSLGSPTRPRVISRSSDTSDTTEIPTPDAEASQEAAQDKRATADGATGGGTSGAASTPDPEASQAAPASSGTGAPAPAVAAPTAADTPPVQNAAPAARAPSPDAEASQAGGTATAAKGAGAALYRLQAGTFTDPKNAHDYLTSLQSRGYDASLHADHQGGQTVYHVQVGAYHGRAAAEDAAAGFRHDGVPVTISPITP